tara:strand:+ start:130 stop:780 length:651 start_codon:yes stop_codon:yes gene_type:complete
MNNITIAILLNDVFLTKVFEEISKNHRDQLNFSIISNDDEISNYNVFITDVINFSKLKDRLSDNHKILCIGEKSNFNNLENKNFEISFLKVPFKFSELKERAENLFSSLKSAKSKIKQFKDFNYDKQNRIIQCDNKNLRVTEKENEIFNYLILQNDKYVPREKLLSEIWNYNKEIDTHTLETHMYSLRKKIDDKLQLKDLIIYKEKKGYAINSKFL